MWFIIRWWILTDFLSAPQYIVYIVISVNFNVTGKIRWSFWLQFKPILKNALFTCNSILKTLKKSWTLFKKIISNIINLWKCLNSNCQQFYKYQQNEQPFLTSNHWTKIKSWLMSMEITSFCFRQGQTCVRVNRSKGPFLSSLWQWWLNNVIFCDLISFFITTQPRLTILCLQIHMSDKVCVIFAHSTNYWNYIQVFVIGSVSPLPYNLMKSL